MYPVLGWEFTAGAEAQEEEEEVGLRSELEPKDQDSY